MFDNLFKELYLDQIERTRAENPSFEWSTAAEIAYKLTCEICVKEKKDEIKSKN